MNLITSKDLKLAEKEKLFKKANREKYALQQNCQDLKQSICSCKKKIIQLKGQLKLFQKKLKLTKYDITIITKESVNEQEIHQELLSLRQREIDSLNEELQAVKIELKEREKQVDQLENKLQATEECLRKKSEAVNFLLEENAKIKRELNLEREKLDLLHRQQIHPESRHKRETQVRN